MRGAVGLSICVLSHNQSAYLGECLAELGRQARELREGSALVSDLEVIVLDNASTDASPEIAVNSLAAFMDVAPAQLVVADENSGPLAGLFRLLRASTKPSALVIHGDDLIAPDYLRRVVAFLDVSDVPVVGIPTLQPLAVGPDGTFVRAGACRQPEFSGLPNIDRIAASVQNFAAVGGTVLPVSESLRALRPHAHLFLACEDWILWGGLLEQGVCFRHIAGAMYLYRIHDTNTSDSPLQSISSGYSRAVYAQSGSHGSRWIARTQVRLDMARSADRDRYKEGLVLGGYNAPARTTGLHVLAGKGVLASWHAWRAFMRRRSRDPDW